MHTGVTLAHQSGMDSYLYNFWLNYRYFSNMDNSSYYTDKQIFEAFIVSDN